MRNMEYHMLVFLQYTDISLSTEILPATVQSYFYYSIVQHQTYSVLIFWVVFCVTVCWDNAEQSSSAFHANSNLNLIKRTTRGGFG